MASHESTSPSGGFTIISWLLLVALKADGFIDWRWTTIVVAPVVVSYLLSLLMAGLARLLSRSMMRRL